MTILYFDLDGTLVDVRRRHYAAYVDTAHELGLTPLPERAYWDRIRQGASNADLMRGADPERQTQFARQWQERVESPSYVRLDTLIPGARATLASLRESYELVLVTLRQDRESLLEQLDELSLTKFFSAIYSADEPAGTGSKAKLIRLLQNDDGKSGVVIGDSEADIEAARELGLRSLCVTTGLRDRSYLSDFGPDDIVDRIVQLPRLLPPA